MPSIPVTHAKSTAIKQQTAIGWRQLFNGHMSKMWSDIQYKYLRSIKLHTRHSNSASWAKQNEQGIKEHQQEILLAKVEALYMLKDRLLAIDRNLMLSTPIE
eukprot:8788898-Ditylum_brightwellii.AAC.1